MSMVRPRIVVATPRRARHPGRLRAVAHGRNLAAKVHAALDTRMAGRDQEITDLMANRAKLEAESDKLLAAHFADAIDLPTRKRHQDRIPAGLRDVPQRPPAPQRSPTPWQPAPSAKPKATSSWPRTSPTPSPSRPGSGIKTASGRASPT